MEAPTHQASTSSGISGVGDPQTLYQTYREVARRINRPRPVVASPVRETVTFDVSHDAHVASFVMATREKRTFPMVQTIIRACALSYGVSREDITSDRRTSRVTEPRHIAMYLARTMTPRSMPDIARQFGNRDHTTVLHAVRKIEAKVTSDIRFAAVVEGLKTDILFRSGLNDKPSEAEQ